jgi:hypothetical protein
MAHHVLSYLCTYDLYGPVLNVFDACRKKDKYFQFSFFVDISVEEHACFVYLFVLLFIWIITVYLLKLFC